MADDWLNSVEKRDLIALLPKEAVKFIGEERGTDAVRKEERIAAIVAQDLMIKGLIRPAKPRRGVFGLARGVPQKARRVAAKGK